MTWTRLSDDFADRPDVLSLSDAAFRAHVSALVWCNRQLTDGHVPTRAAGLVGASDESVVAELVDAGLWERVTEGYQVDWADQEPAERVHERRAFNAEKQARYRSRKDKHAAGDHSECDPRFCRNATGDVTRNTGGNSPRSVTATRPVPSRPDPKGGTGTGTGGAAVAASGALATPAPSRSAAILNLPRRGGEHD